MAVNPEQGGRVSFERKWGDRDGLVGASSFPEEEKLGCVRSRARPLLQCPNHSPLEGQTRLMNEGLFRLKREGMSRLRNEGLSVS